MKDFKRSQLFFKLLHKTYCILLYFYDRVPFTDGGATPISTGWRQREPEKVPERGESPKEQLLSLGIALGRMG